MHRPTVLGLAAFLVAIVVASLMPVRAQDPTPGCGGSFEPKCEFAAAVSHGPAANFGCDGGQFFDPRSGGECWSCPGGYIRTLTPVTDQRACAKDLIFGPWSAATYHRSVWGCPAGTFLDIGLGSCWSCPAGHNRSIHPVDGPLACTVAAELTCDPGLVLHAFAAHCTPTEAEYAKPSDEEVLAAYASAREQYGYAEDLLDEVAGPLSDASPGPPDRPDPVRAKIWQDLESVIKSDQYDFQTATMVSVFDIAVVAGYAHGWGVALGPASAQDPPLPDECREYFTNTGSLGISVGLAAGVEVGLWLAPLDGLSGWESSVTVGGAAVAGAAYTWSFQRNEQGELKLSGVSIRQTGGLGLDLAIAHGHSFTGKPANCYVTQ